MKAIDLHKHFLNIVYFEFYSYEQLCIYGYSPSIIAGENPLDLIYTFLVNMTIDCAISIHGKNINPVTSFNQTILIKAHQAKLIFNNLLPIIPINIECFYYVFLLVTIFSIIDNLYFKKRTVLDN